MTHDEIAAALARIDTATLYEANRQRGALPYAIKPVHRAFRVAGPAFTVAGPAGDNLWLHHAIAQAQPGDVIVASVCGGHAHGYWGEVMSVAARERRLSGLVLDGCVRDEAALLEVGFPVFSRGLSIVGTGKDPHGLGSIGKPIAIGDAVIATGDLVFGDGNGVVVVAAAEVEAAIASALERQNKEVEIFARLKRGETTLDVYALPSLPRPRAAREA